MLGTITKGEYKDQPPLPDNVYLARLIGVKEKQPPQSHPDWAVTLSWTFEILTDPYKKRRAWGRTPSSWISQKKLDNWLVTCGINVAKGTSLRIEDLKDVYVKILVKGKKYNDKQTGEEKIFSEVTELLPLDSLDHIKVREFIAGTTAPAQQSQPVVVTATHTVTPVQPTVTNVPPAGTFTPSQTPFTSVPNSAGTPSRTIPF
jgi:hypothetical protein